MRFLPPFRWRWPPRPRGIMTFPIGIALNEIKHEGVAGPQSWIWAALRADRAGLDFLTLGDQALAGVGQTALDASLLAAAMGPLTQRIGLFATAPVTQHEPFHVSTAIATLDYVSQGRAGVIPAVPAVAETAALYARTGETLYGVPQERAAIYHDAADAVEVVRRLWDSWEEDSIIRDAATGRFIDRDKLHYVDYQGEHLFVRGPSIVPRPPQGQPPLAVVWREPADLDWARAQADILFAPQWVNAAGVRLYADLAVAFETEPSAADADGAPVFRGSPAELAEQARGLIAQGYAGLRLHPRRLDTDLDRINLEFLPLLRGAPAAGSGPLRARLGLPPAINRYRATLEG
ncbi:LLM class flavin-dependent oxidoreductase [Bordetella avium]|nr:LLM class flavin-dependent oxidoreductase [Bordetella avium]